MRCESYHSAENQHILESVSHATGTGGNMTWLCVKTTRTLMETENWLGKQPQKQVETNLENNQKSTRKSNNKNGSTCYPYSSELLEETIL